MTRLNTVSHARADGIVKQGYDLFKTHFGTIPKPMEMLSPSPELFGIQLARNRYFATQSNLSFSLLAHIRYLAAVSLAYPFCADFNRDLLKKQGLSDEDIRKMEKDPLQSLLEENESALLAFVIRALKAPADITDRDVENLRELGWTDRDLVDAMTQGVSMFDHAVMMQVFDMAPFCVSDGRGKSREES